VIGKVGDEWKIAITAPPIEGRANKACVAFLGKILTPQSANPQPASDRHS
jgi:uncharacterized protein YggU (UPF0235/DUF167 family)